MIEPGQLVAGYRVISPLGSGSMGTVFRVDRLTDGLPFALKYLPLASARMRERLVREARAMASLNHPNVVQLVELIEIEGDPGLILEFVDGPSLEDWLAGERPNLEVAERVFRGIVAGVAHAHTIGLVHRDLKPSNVLLVSTPEGVHPKVADFGIAKSLDPESSGPITRTGMSLGSPAYMAPEQIRDAREVDPRADIWSLGALLYELCCGARAFAGSDPLTVMNAVAAGTYDDPAELTRDLPERIRLAIRGALTVDPAVRIPSCDVLLAVLSNGDASAVPGWPAPQKRRADEMETDEATAPRRVPNASAGALPWQTLVAVGAGVAMGAAVLLVLAWVLFGWLAPVS